MRILVTGAAGYIGSIMTEVLLRSGYHVLALDDLSHGYLAPIRHLQKHYGTEKLVFYDHDIRYPLEKVLDAYSYPIDMVIHFAALCRVDESYREPQMYYSVNTEGTRVLLDSLSRYDISHLIFSSTCSVYGEPEQTPVEETAPIRPLSPYAQSKYEAERLIHTWGVLQDTQYMIFRYFNVSGATIDGSLGDSKKPSALLIPNLVKSALGIAPFQLTCRADYPTPDGTPIRDFVHVLDICDAHLQAILLLSQTSHSHHTCNLGSGTGLSVREIQRAVQNILKAHIHINQSPEIRSQDIAQIYAHAGHAYELLGWRPRYTVEDMISSLAHWYRQHPSGWSA